MGETIAAWIYDRRWICMGACLGLAVVAGLFVTRVGVDNSVEIWFLENDPSLESYQEFQVAFGNDETVVIAFHREKGILDQAGLEKIRKATEAVEKVKGVTRVVSISNVPDGLATEEVVPSESIAKDPFLTGRLVGRDGKTAVLLAVLEANDNIDAVRHGVLTGIGEALDLLKEPYRMAGTGVIYDALNQAATKDAGAVLGLSYLVIIFLLWIFLRRLMSMMVALGTVGLATTWLFGIYGAAGRDINMVTMVMPTLILIVGLADSVHIMMYTARLPGYLSRRERVMKGVGFMFWPCLFNTLTTGGAFLALTASPMAVVRDLGLFCAVGLVGAFISAVVICVFALHWQKAEPSIKESGFLNMVTGVLARSSVNHPWIVLAASLVLAGMCSWGVSQVQEDTYSIGFLKESHSVRQHSEFIEENFGPYTPLEILVKAENDLLKLGMLGKIETWQQRSVDNGHAGWAFSVVDVLKRVGQRGGIGYELPENQRFLDLALEEMKQEAGNMYDQVVESENLIRVTFGIPMRSARGMKKSLENIMGQADFSSGTRLVPSGYIPLYVRMMEYIVDTQVNSFVIAFLIIFLLIGILFRSVRFTLLALPSNLLPVLVTLGIMGLTGIRLDVATVTIAAIVLGLVVDDTVHFLYHLRFELKEGDNAEEAASRSVRTVGHSMVLSSIVLVIGFAMLGLASVKSVSYFGLLCALAMFSAILADLLVVPALVKAFRIKTG
jgi:predicted RND superfamily exporter protein